MKKKLTGLQINNFPKEITEDEVVNFLKEHAQKDLESVNFQLTDTKRNNENVIIFSGMSPHDMLAAMEKIDFKESKEKFLTDHHPYQEKRYNRRRK